MVPAGQWGTVKFTPREGVWNLSGFAQVAYVLRNPGATRVHLRSFVGNAKATDWSDSAISEGFLRAGSNKTVNTFLFQPASELEKFPVLKTFTGMCGLPGGFLRHWHTINPAAISFLQFSIFPAEREQTLEIVRVAATRPFVPDLLRREPDKFFPFLDRYGQFKHDEWTGKIHADQDLKKSAQVERAELAALPGPADWDKFGGWARGPQLKATGNFRTEKINGRWWFVDPAGKLFWSLGVNAVGVDAGGTPVSDREKWFAWLPQPDEPFAEFFGGHVGTQDFDFASANRRRKYGADWRGQTRELIPARLRSWALNTLGAWSSDDLCRQDRTAYTRMISFWCDTIQKRAPDPFSRSFHDRA